MLTQIIEEKTVSNYKNPFQNTYITVMHFLVYDCLFRIFLT